MHDDPVDEPVPAGPFGRWLEQMLSALAGAADADVPCGSCIGCCASAQFVHVAPDEHDALAHIPAELLFPAPRLPPGHVLMGYDARGRCPMLTDAGCSIYAHRPRTCRTYDCRVFPAAAVDVGDDKPLVAERARRWRFDHPSDDDEVLHAAVRAAAAFIDTRRDELANDVRPSTSTQLAVAALDAHVAFAEPGGGPVAIDDVVAALRARHH